MPVLCGSFEANTQSFFVRKIFNVDNIDCILIDGCQRERRGTMISNRHQNGFAHGDDGRLPGGAASANRRETASATLNVMGLRIPKKAAIGALAVSGVLAVVGPDLDFSAIRRLNLATTCIHNIYINDFKNATILPSPPERSDDYVPTHIKMCYEWLRRDALSVDGAIMHRVNILEHEDVCQDWAAPHYSMMEIIANSVLHTILPRMRYLHGCPSHREYEETKRGYDWSTFQSVLQDPNMAVNQGMVDPQLYIDQCKYCLAEYDKDADAARIRSRSMYHCFAFPEESNLYKDPIQIVPVTVPTVVALPNQPDVTKSSAPISALLRPLRTRLVHSAAEWSNVTDSPPREPSTGTVILIDPGTIGIDPNLLDDFIDPDTTSITILAGPLCYAANLPTGQNCFAYGEQLRDHLRQKFPNRDTNGFEGKHGIDFQISGSTAGTISRAILADDLLCPPRTATCLLPPVGKPPNTKATVLGIPCPGCPGSGVPEVKFFENVGTNGNTDVVLLPDSALPPITEGTPNAPAYPDVPQGNPDVPIPPEFPAIQQPIQGDGFPMNYPNPPAKPDLATLAALPSYEAYKGVEPKLPPSVAAASNENPEENSPLENTPNVQIDHSNTPGIPTAEEIQQALDEAAPLDTNTPTDPNQEPAEPVDPASQTPELATDEGSGLAARPLSDESYIDLAVERRNSKDRIITGYDGNYLFEVPCPTEDDAGNAVVLVDGVTLTDNGDTVIVSDGHGTVTFESPVDVSQVEVQDCQMTDPVTGVTTTEECVEIPDPSNSDPDATVNVTQTGKIGCDCDREALQVTNELGQLVTEPDSNNGCLLTMGEARLLAKKNPDDPKKHTIIEGKVVSAGNENIPPTDLGTVVMNPDGSSYAVTQQTDEFHGFQHIDPLDGNTGQYQEFIDIPLKEDILQVPWDQCQVKSPPIPIMMVMKLGNTIMYDLAQTFKGGEISWVATNTYDMFYGGVDQHCIKVNEVPYGPMQNSRRWAKCFPNAQGVMEATIDFYVHDGSKKFGQDPALANDPSKYDITPYIPADCNPSQDYGKKCKFKYRVKCEPVSYGPFRRRLGETSAAAAAPEETRLLFAKNLLDKCPELGRKKEVSGKFEKFTFGGKGQNTRAIPVHMQGQPPIYPGKIARILNGDDSAMGQQ